MSTVTAPATKLTARQSEVLQVIRQYMDTNGAPPTRAEIADKLGFKSINAAEDHLRALARKGAIALAPGTSRGIQLLGMYALGVPLIGQVAAGAPILAQENIEDRIQLDKQLFEKEPSYLLKVKGLSMKNAGIFDGDYLVVHKQSEAHNGQIVVARLEDNVTVKRFYRQNNQVLLKPENDDFEVIHVDLAHQKLTIEGIGIGVVRTLT